YELNLIDTPGHVDFTYEVSRSLQACEGAILVVDASQGIQAQTLSNLFLALDAGLEIIPVLNKIDLPGAEPDRRAQELHELIGAKPEEILRISAKEGTHVPELLEAVVRRIPAPRGVADAPRRARQAAAQRRVAALRARVLSGARVRVSVRVPRTAPHGDRAGAAPARVQPRPHQHGAERGVPRPQDGRHRGAGREPEPDAARLGGRPHRGAVRRGADRSARREPQGADPAAAVRGRDPSRDRDQGDRPRDGPPVAQERDHQVVWG